MATYQGKSFNNQSVVVDGNRYVGCTFTNCSLTYRGGELPQFENCVFRGGSIQLTGAAFATIKYLNKLHQGGLSDPVEAVLAEVESGNPSLTPRPAGPTPLQLGTNFGQLGAIAVAATVFTLLIIVALVYGFWLHPEFVTLRADPPAPIAVQFPLNQMPSLPDDLSAAYDRQRAEQLERVNRYGWADVDKRTVQIPLSEAIKLVIQQNSAGSR